MISPDASDADLLADTDDAADSFAIFYRRHAVAVMRYLASRGADAELAADVVADTFFAALSLRLRYRAEHETARLWLLGIASRRLADARRREGRERARVDQVARLQLTAADRDSYADLLDSVEMQDVLADLPESERRAIIARVLEDRSYTDIADALGLTEAGARKRVSRGLARLRTRMERP